MSKFEHVRLAAEDRDTRAKITDAIAVLREKAKFTARDRATIEVGLLQPNSGETVGMAEVLFEAPWVRTVYRVPLRTAARFRGRRQGSAERVDYEIIRLNLAHVDFSGTVTLADQMVVYAVEVHSASMLTEPSDLDWRIIHAALRVIEGGDACYRSLQEDAPVADPQMVPDLRYLDCARLSKLQLPPLKTIIAGMAKVDPDLKASGQKIADALRKLGLRVPTPRPRRNAAKG